MGKGSRERHRTYCAECEYTVYSDKPEIALPEEVEHAGFSGKGNRFPTIRQEGRGFVGLVVLLGRSDHGGVCIDTKSNRTKKVRESQEYG